METSSSTCSASHTLLPSASTAPQGSRQCEGVGITEGVQASQSALLHGPYPRTRARGWHQEGTQASQSALLHGPEIFLRWGCRSMSSCDGVRPIFNLASAHLPDRVTSSPRGKLLPTPSTQGTSPTTGLVYAVSCARRSFFRSSSSIFLSRNNGDRARERCCDTHGKVRVASSMRQAHATRHGRCRL